MNDVRYTIRISGLKAREGTIPLLALREISDAILLGSERSLRLAIEGASVRKGRVPKWLSKSLAFTMAGVRKGSTLLELEAPTLAESAAEQIRQQDLWYTLPKPEDTALSILAKSVHEATSEQLESEYFDRGVLGALLCFRSVFEKYAKALEVTSDHKPADNFRLGNEELKRIGKMEAQTPEPHAAVIAGSFNLIEHAQRRFQLDLGDGRKIPGKADSSYVSEEDMRNLWGKKVTIKGIAHFNPSGKARFIEAQVIRTIGTGEQVFERIPASEPPERFVEKLGKKKEASSPLREVWGKWPGDESIEEILAALTKSTAEVA
ncbi:MAG: hypothetical protein HY673_21950 [Chloroflexi bacterium]|nr:hypothetical protein [Chloroflexota bacterium]